MQQVPLPAEESIKHMVAPKGLKVELVAADPDIYRPICMNWDEQGRLWIAETMDYPHNIQPSGSGKGNDRLVICEDTKGDRPHGQVHRVRRQAQHPGGLHVLQRRRHRLRRTTRPSSSRTPPAKARPTTARSMFGTWGQGDTHGGVSNMRYGLDNWIWAMQGYNNSTVTVGGETHTFKQGFFRFKPDASKLEFLRSTNNNTWGLGISEEGLIFGSTANGNPSVAMAIPNRYYESVKGWKVAFDKSGGSIAGNPSFKPVTDKVRQVDYFGRYTAAAGHALYTARNYPAGILESHRVRDRADRPPGRHVCHHSRRNPLQINAIRSTCWPATTSGPRRSWPRSARTATSGSSTGTAISSSTIRRRRASRPARAAPIARTCAIRSLAGFTRSCREFQATARP